MTTPATKARNPVVGFALDTVERAVKTAAQTAMATFGGGAINVWHLPWHDSAGIVAGSAMLSVLSSLASVPVGNRNSASLVK